LPASGRWSAAPVEGRPEDALDRRGVVVLEVVLGHEGARRRDDGRRWQRQDLKPCAVEGDEVHVDEAVAQDEIVVQRELEGGADPVVGVKLTPLRSPARTRKK